MDDVLVYGNDAKVAAIKLHLAGAELLHDEYAGRVGRTLFIHPSTDPFSTPNTAEDVREIQRVHRLIVDNPTSTIVIRAVGSRSAAGSSPTPQLDLEDDGDFSTQLINKFADPDTLVDAQIHDVNFSLAHEPVRFDVDSPDDDVFDVQACVSRLRETWDDTDAEVEQDPEDGTGTLFTLPLRQFVDNLQHLRTAGCNVVSGVRTTPCRRMEVIRRYVMVSQQ